MWTCSLVRHLIRASVGWVCRDTSRENGKDPREFPRNAERALLGRATMFRMEEASTALVAAPPAGPGEQQGRTARRRPEQVGEQMTHFGNGERKQRIDRRFFSRRWLSGEHASYSANACKACLDDHDESYVPIPTSPASDFVILQTHFFPCLETFFNFPPLPNRLDHLRKRGAYWGKDEVIRLVLRIVQRATDEQKVLPVIFTSMQHGHDCPIKEPRSFGAVAHRDPLPILGVKQKRLGLGHRHPFATLARLYFHRFRAGNGQDVGVMMGFQPGTQIPIPAVDGISNDPGEGDLGFPEALDHLSGLLTFGVKAHLFWNACLSAPLPILDPAQGDVEFSIDQRVAPGAHVGQKYSHLTIFQLACCAAMLIRHPC